MSTETVATGTPAVEETEDAKLQKRRSDAWQKFVAERDKAIQAAVTAGDIVAEEDEVSFKDDADNVKKESYTRYRAVTLNGALALVGGKPTPEVMDGYEKDAEGNYSSRAFLPSITDAVSKYFDNEVRLGIRQRLEGPDKKIASVINKVQAARRAMGKPELPYDVARERALKMLGDE